jgi:hypothetical protein
VVPGTPAEEAGFGTRPYLITAIDGSPVDTRLLTYCRAVGKARSGDSAVLTVVPSGSRQSEEMEVGFA